MNAETPEQVAARLREETEKSLEGRFSPEGRRAVESVLAAEITRLRTPVPVERVVAIFAGQPERVFTGREAARFAYRELTDMEADRG